MEPNLMKEPTQALENASADCVALERTGTVGAARTGAGTPRAVRTVRTVRTVRAGTGAWAERRTADMDADCGPGIGIVRIVPRRGRDDDGPADDDRRGRDDNRGRRYDDRFFFHDDGRFFHDDRRRNHVLRRRDAYDDGARGRRREMTRG